MAAQTDVISRQVSVKVLPAAPVDVMSRLVSVKVLPAAPVDLLSRQFSVDVPFPDLAASVQSYPAAARAASYIDLSYVVSITQGTAHAPWDDVIGLSVDQIVGNADDITLATLVHGTDLDFGNSYTDGASVWLPPTVSGAYWVFVQTDATGAVEENGATANNIAFGANPISIQAFTGDILTGGTLISSVDGTHDGKDIVVESGQVSIDGEHSFLSLLIHEGAVVTHTAGLAGGMELTVAGDVMITADSSIDVSGKGYAPGQGPGAFRTDAGASHGGLGGFVDVGQHLSYGTINGPRDLGSGGGFGRPTSGGGAVRLVVGGELTLGGSIRAHGFPTSDPTSLYWAYGGGAGGSLWVTAGQVSGAGGILAEGGKGNQQWPNSSAGGGGGRVHLEVGDGSGFAGPVVAFGGSGRMHGGAGTVLIEDASAGTSELLILNFQPGLSIASNPLIWGVTVLPSGLPYDSVVIDDGVRLEVDKPSYGLRLAVGGDFYLGAGAAIWGKAHGFQGAEGPGGDDTGYNGAGHGGSGGGFGGAAYDNLALPQLPGSGVFVGAQVNPYAHGGGAVVLDVAGDMIVDGLINVDASGMGGAGGTALLLADTVSGSGNVSAKGGQGYGTIICQSTWGSGAGGRVAMHARDPGGLSGYGGTIDVSGGTYIPCGGGPAGTGTYYPAHTSTPVVTPIPLIVDHEDFDQLPSITQNPLNTAPDRVPTDFSGSWGNAGAWGYPPTYDTFALGDNASRGMSIVDSTSFDANKQGNSLALREAPPTIGQPFPKLFVSGLWRDEAYRHIGTAVRVEASIWVSSDVVGGGGGILSVANGNGKLATSSLAPINDMGPTIEWDGSTGLLVAHLAGMGSVQVIDLPTGPPGPPQPYPTDTWQRVRMDIDLSTDTYNLWWAPVGQPLTLVAQALPFVTNQQRLDRFVVGQQQFAKAFYDDFLVDFGPSQASVNVIATNCIGPAGPMVLTSNLPVLGTTFQSTVTGFASTSLAIAIVGYSSQSIPLSSILPVGIAGCDLLASPDVIVLSVPVAGASSYQLAMPGSTALAGINLYHQFLQLELTGSGATVSLSSSNGLQFILGF